MIKKRKLEPNGTPMGATDPGGSRSRLRGRQKITPRSHLPLSPVFRVAAYETRKPPPARRQTPQGSQPLDAQHLLVQEDLDRGALEIRWNVLADPVMPGDGDELGL